jgi:hypothetical protein
MLTSPALSRLVLPLLFAAAACGGDDLVLPESAAGTLAIVEGNGQEGSAGAALPNPLIVRLTDDQDVGIPDRTVVWVVNSGGGTISPSTGMTDAEGFASAEWTLGPAGGSQRVTAQVPGIGTVTFTAASSGDGDGDGGEPVPASVERVEGDGQSAPVGTEVPVEPAVRVLDEEGRPVEGYEVTFVVVGGGGSVSGATRTTGADGIARVGGWTLGPTPGTNTLEARAGSLAGSPVIFTAEGTQAEPEPEVDRLVFLTPPPDAEVSERFPVEVALVDADGDVVPLSGIVIYVALFEEDEDSPSNALLTGERFESTEDGVAEFDLAVEREGRYRLRALTDDLPELGPHGPEPYLFSEVFEVD